MEFDNSIFEKNNLRPNDIDLEGSYPFKDVLLINVDGILDTYNSSDFSDLVLESLKSKVKILVLDLNNLSYASSAGLESLIKIKINSNDIDVYFLNLNGKILESLKLLGFYNTKYIISNLNDIYNDVKNIFPLKSKCLKCDISLNIFKSGTFNCKNCNQPLTVDIDGNIKIGGEY